MTILPFSRAARRIALVAAVMLGSLGVLPLGLFRPANGANTANLVATIPGATGLVSDRTTGNAFVSASDGNVRQITPAGVVTVVNWSKLIGAATGLSLDEVNHVLFVSVAGSPGSIWSIPEAGGAPSLSYTLTGTKSPTGVSYSNGFVAISTGSSGTIEFVDTSGTLQNSCQPGPGIAPSGISMFVPTNLSTAAVVVADHTNSTILITDSTCTVVGSKHLRAGVNSVAILAFVGTQVLSVGTSKGIALTMNLRSLIQVTTNPDVSGLAVGQISEPSFSLWQLDGGQYIHRLTQPTDLTNAVAVAGDQSARISWNPPVDNGGFNSLSYNVIPVEDTSKGCSTTLTHCTITGLTNGQTYHFSVSTSLGGGSVLSNGVTPTAAPVTTSTPPATTTTTTASGSLAVTGDDAGLLGAVGISCLLLGGGAVALRRRVTRA